nr:LysR family transcriptional regulator [uncultured Gellertiella sp.]
MDTLTRIRAFIDVVEAEGFSAAARKVGRSKALLSKYVRELEDEIGALLLNRTTRQFSLTEAGHTYYRTAADILKEIDNLADLVRENNADLKGRLRISVPRTYMDAEIGQSLIDFAIAYPDLSLEIVAEDRFVDLIEEGFDVAVRITKLEDSGMIARKLTDFQVYICATPAFIATHGPFREPMDLARVPAIIDTNSRTHNAVRFYNPDGTGTTVPLAGRMEVNSPRASLRAARAGLGLGIIPDFIAQPYVLSGELQVLFGDCSPKDRGIYAIYPHRRYLPAKVRIFVDFLSTWFKKSEQCETFRG